MKKCILLLLLIALVSGCSPAESPSGEPPSPATPTPLAEASPTATPAQEEPSDRVASSYTRQESLSMLLEEEAPDFTLETLEGDTVSLSDYRGKIVFLSFWQTWCGPCRNEMPYFDALMQQNEDVVVLAVNALPGEGVGDAEAQVRSFIEEQGFTFPVLLDRDGSIFSMEAYLSRYIPANYIIDKEGILRIRANTLGEEDMAVIVDVMRGLDW